MMVSYAATNYRYCKKSLYIFTPITLFSFDIFCEKMLLRLPSKFLDACIKFETGLVWLVLGGAL